MNDWEGVDVALSRYGLPAKHADRPKIIAALQEQIRLERDDAGDQFLMRVLCAQLFSSGVVEDCMLIWEAKSCNFDTHCGIDVQFVCGAGLEQTAVFLRSQNSVTARDALEYLNWCDSDFEDFSVERVFRDAREFYRVV